MNKYPKIDEFSLSNGVLKHKEFGNLSKTDEVPYFIDSVTVGHLWIYNLIAQKGFDYIIPIMDYAKRMKSCLFEWNINAMMMREIGSMYQDMELKPELLINGKLNLKKYYGLLEKAKSHQNEYYILSEFLVMLHKYEHVSFF